MDRQKPVLTLNKINNLFRSIKLAIALILIIALTSIVSTFIPQNRDLQFYMQNYGNTIAKLITVTGFDSFFSSLLFIIPSILFFINLSVCTFNRFYGRIKRRASKRFGPDILHIGLLILMVGGIITATGKQEAFVKMAEGDKVELTGGYSISLTSFEFLKYDNGRPKDWISTVKLEKDGQIIEEAFPIEVNRPLKAGSKKIYQVSYSVINNLYISDPEGNIYKLNQGQAIPVNNGVMVFRDIDTQGSEPKAIFEKRIGETPGKRAELSEGSYIDKYIITGMNSELTSGLQIVDDPGYYIVLTGLILLITGLFLTYYQKLGDNKI